MRDRKRNGDDNGEEGWRKQGRNWKVRSQKQLLPRVATMKLQTKTYTATNVLR